MACAVTRDAPPFVRDAWQPRREKLTVRAHVFSTVRTPTVTARLTAMVTARAVRVRATAIMVNRVTVLRFVRAVFASMASAAMTYARLIVQHAPRPSNTREWTESAGLLRTATPRLEYAYRQFLVAAMVVAAAAARARLRSRAARARAVALVTVA